MDQRKAYRCFPISRVYTEPQKSHRANLIFAAVRRQGTLHNACKAVVESIESRLLFDAAADFGGGNGSATVDQYQGITGNGWATAWSANPSSGSAAFGSATVTSASPMSSNANHFAGSLTASAAGGGGAIARGYANAGSVSATGIHEIRFVYRYDGSLSGFTSVADTIALFGDTAARTGTRSTNTWSAVAYGGAVGGVAARTWAFGDSSGLAGTDVPLVTGTIYSFTIDVDPANRMYSATVSDGIVGPGHTASVASLDFRSTSTSTSYIHVGLALSAANETGSFSFDTVRVSSPTLPATPSGVTATTISASQVDLSWADNTTHRTRYRIERSTDDASWTLIETLSPNATEYSNTGLSDGTRYYYQVWAVNEAGTAKSLSANATTALPAATNLAATTASASQINLTWQDNSANESGFLIDRATNAAFTQNLVTLTAAANATGKADTGLSPATTYYYRVRATNARTASANSDAIFVTTPTVAPGGLAVTGSTANEVNLNWSAVTAATGYRVERSTDGGSSWAQVGPIVSTTLLQDTTVSANATYAYRVRAISSGGDSAASAAVSVTTPLGVPGSLTATPLSANRVDLSWVAGAGATSYSVERGTGGANWVTIGTAATTAFSDTTAAAGTTYTYRVRSVAGAATSLPSVTANALTYPAAPASLTATGASTGRINLTWSASTGVTSYAVQRSAAGVGDWVQLGTVIAAAYQDDTAAEGTQYDYRVRASNASGDSVYSTTASGTTLLSAPTNLVTDEVTAASVRLTWTDASSAETGYTVERSVDSAFSSPTPYTLAAGATGYTVNGLADGTRYYFRVRASNLTTASAYATAVTAVTALPAPTGLAVTMATATAVTLSWTDQSANESGFAIERATDPTFASITTLTAQPNAGGLTDTGLSNGKIYYYRIKAVNASATSAVSLPVTAITVLPTPTALTATATSPASVTLTWQDVSATESGFRIKRKTGSDGDYTVIATAAANATSYVDDAVDPGVRYYYRVYAINTDAESAASDAATTVSPLVTPGTPTLAGRSANSLDLTWTDTSGNETSFEVDVATDSAFAGVVSHIVPADSTSYTATGLADGTLYFVRVRAINGVAASAYTATLSAVTLLPAPANLTVTAAGDTGVSLAWSASSSNESGFAIERSADAAFTQITNLTAPAHSTAFLDSGLANGRTYYYRLKAINAEGESAYSSVVTATTTLPTPAEVTAMAGPNGVTLAWQDRSGTESGFEIARRPVGGTFALLGTVGADVTMFADSSTVSGNAYEYAVRAVNAITTSAYSAPTGVVVPIAAPTGLAVVAITADGLDLAWSDASNTESGFDVEISTAPSFETATVITLAAGTTAYSASGLADGTTYYVRVKSFNAVSASFSAVVTATTSMLPPASLTLTSVRSTAIDLAWTDQSAAESGFLIERSTDDNFVLPVTIDVPANATTWTDDTLSPETTYFYRVKATGLAADSDYTPTVTATTAAAGPFGLEAFERDTSHVELTWVDTGDGDTAFVVERRTGAAGSFDALATIDAGETEYTDTNLLIGRQYAYRVRAVMGGDYTNVVTLTITDAPTRLQAVARGTSSIGLTWKDRSEAETGFVIEQSPDGVQFTPLATLPANTTGYTAAAAEGTRVYYRVKASLAAGDTDYSAVDYAATDLVAPTAFAVATATVSGVNLTWHDNSSAETRYELTASHNGVAMADPALLPAGTQSFTMTGLEAGTYYSFTLTAKNDVSSSATVSAAGETFAVDPAVLTAEATGPTSAHLSWTDPTDGDGMWAVRRSTAGAGGPFVTLITLAPGTTSFDDVSPQENRTYWYRVAESGTDNAHQSPAAAVLTPVQAASALTATPVSPTEVQLDWVNGSVVADAIKVQYATDGQTFHDAFTLGGTEQTVIVSDLEPETAYTFRLATSAADHVTRSSTVVAATPAVAVPAPQDVTVMQTTPTSMSLQWTDLTDGVASFVVEKTDDGIHYTPLTELDPGTTEYTAEGLTAGRSYGLRVRSVVTSQAGRAARSSTQSQSGSVNTPSAAAYEVARDKNVAQRIAGYDVLEGPARATLVSGTVGPTFQSFGWSTSPLFKYPSWLNADGTEPINIQSALTGFGVGRRGFSNVRAGTIIDLGFNDGGLINGPGADFVLISAYGNDPGAGGRGALYSNQREFEVAVDTNEFQDGRTVTEDDFTDDVGPGLLQTHFGQYSPVDAATYASLYFSTAAFDLSDFGVAANEQVNAVRVKSLDSESDLLGVGSLHTALNLNIDSDNDSGLDVPTPMNHRRAEDDAEDDPTRPGKILTLSESDSDDDGILDARDGFNADPADARDDLSAGSSFVPMPLTLPNGVDFAHAAFTLTYDDQQPLDETDTGSTCIWLKDGGLARNASSAALDGDFVPSGVAIDAARLGFTAEKRTVTLWLEAVAIGSGLDNNKIEVTLNKGTPQTLNAEASDAVRASRFTTQYVQVDDNGNTTPTDHVEVTYSSPVFSNVQFTVSGVHFSADKQHVLGDVSISGQLDDSVSDSLSSAEGGTINQVAFYLNDATEPTQVIGTSVSKTSGGSLVKPFDFGASFSYSLSNVELQPGGNTFKLAAANAFKNIGTAEGAATLNVVAPPDETAAVRLKRDQYAVTVAYRVNGGDWQTASFSKPQASSTYAYTNGTDLIGFAASPFEGSTDASYTASFASTALGLNVQDLTLTRTSPVLLEGSYVRSINAGQDTIDVRVAPTDEFALWAYSRKDDGPESQVHLSRAAGQSGYVFEGGGVTLDAGTSEPFAAALTDDGAVVTVTNSSVGLTGELLAFYEDTPSVLSSSRLLTEVDRPDYTGYTVAVDPNGYSPVDVSTPGGFKPTMIQVVGSFNPVSIVNHFRLGDSTADRPVTVYQENAYVGAGDSGNNRPAVFIAAPKTTDPPNTTAVPPVDPKTQTFVGGLGDGLTAPLVELKDTAGSVIDWAKKEWNDGIPFSLKVAFYLQDQAPRAAATLNKVTDVASQTLTALGPVLQDLIASPEVTIERIVAGTYPGLEQVPGQIRQAFDFGKRLLMQMVNHLTTMSDYDKGWYLGYAVTTIATQVAANALTAGLASISETLFLEKALPAFRRAGGVFSTVADEVEAAISASTTIGMCFVAGTLVSTPNGYKPIEAIKPGDLVLSRDADSGEQAYKPVVATTTTHPDALYTVTYDEDGPGGRPAEQIVTTAPHPFYVTQAHDFVTASGLKAGDRLSLSDGRTADVVSVTSEAAPIGRQLTTYNFEVKDFHTYFVGDDGVWVHNSGVSCTARSALYAFMHDLKRVSGKGWETYSEFVALTAPNAAAVTRSLEKAASIAMKDVYEAAAGNFLKVPTVDQMKAVMYDRLKSAGLNIHHTMPQSWAEKLLRKLPQYVGYSDGQIQTLLDSMPGMLLSEADHLDFGKGSKGFHAILNRLLPTNSKSDKAKILEKIGDAYEDWDSVAGPKVWAVARAWLAEKGVS